MQTQITTIAPFIGGLNTELTDLSDNPAFTTEESNCKIYHDATRGRRYGLGPEDDGVALTTSYKAAATWEDWLLTSEGAVANFTEPGEHTFEITETDNYFVVVVGAGGGGSNKAGGAGGGIIFRTVLKPATYTCVVGEGGAGASAYVRNNDGETGGFSSFTGPGVSVKALGGIRRKGRRNGGDGGTTGTVQLLITQGYKVLERTTDGEQTNKSFITEDVEGYGAGGIEQSNDEGAGYAGKDGLVFVIPASYGATEEGEIYETPLTAVSGYYWDSYDKAGNSCIVVQKGKYLEVYPSTKPFSRNPLASLDISEYIIDLDSYLKSAMSYTSGEDFLIPHNAYLKPFYVKFTGVELIPTEFSLKVRDLLGLNDGLAYGEAPDTLTDFHKYNLYNQGWSQKNIDAFYNDTTADDFYNQSGQVSDSGLNPTITNFTPVTGTTKVYPANNLQWFIGRNTSKEFDASELVKAYFGNTPAPRGKFILDFMNKDRASAADIEGIPVEATEGSIKSCIFYSGRFFYLVDNTVLFSQVVKDNDACIGFCYQEADPTSEDVSDIIDTDGGSIMFQDLGKPHKLAKYLLGLLVFGSKNVYSIQSETGTSFSATSYGTEFITNAGAYNKDSIVAGDNQVYYWSPLGIYGIGPDQTTGLSAKAVNISENTIQTWYNSLPVFSKENAKGVFDYINNRIIWFYPTDKDNVNRLDAYLQLHLKTGAFYPGKLADGGYVLSTFLINRPTKIEPSIALWAGEDIVYDDEENEVVSHAYRTELDEYVSFANLAYITDEGKIFFCDFNDRDFIDWQRNSYDSYFVSFPINFGSTYVKKNTPILQPYFKRTEEGALKNGEYLVPSGCKLRVRWCWANEQASNRWDIEQQGYIPLKGFMNFKYVNTKIRLRGKGEAVQVSVMSEPLKDFRLSGLNVMVRS